MRAVRALFVVELSPTLDQHFGFGKTSEPFAVLQLVSELPLKLSTKPFCEGLPTACLVT